MCCAKFCSRLETALSFGAMTDRFLTHQGVLIIYLVLAKQPRCRKPRSCRPLLFVLEYYLCDVRFVVVYLYRTNGAQICLGRMSSRGSNWWLLCRERPPAGTALVVLGVKLQCIVYTGVGALRRLSIQYGILPREG